MPAAARAGIPFVAVRTGASSPETWSTQLPFGILSDVGALLEWLERRGCLDAR